jgi:tetratricopeptide (TPR) repeat protein
MASSAAGRPAEGNVQYHEILKSNPLYAPALRSLALNEVASGQFSEARPRLEQVLKLTPRDPIAHLALAEVFFGAKEFAQAVDHYEQSGDLHLQDPRALINYATAGPNPDKARAALSQRPGSATPAQQFQAGVLLANLKDFAGAAHRFELAKKDHADPSAVGFNLALVYLSAGRHSDAIRTADRLLAAGHRKAELFNVLARAHKGAGQVKEAYEAYRSAIQTDPADETSYIDLIALCLKHKNLSLALEIAQIGVARMPDSARLNLQRGIVYAMKGQFSEARTAFEVAPDHPLTAISLGLVLMQMDKVPEAIDVLRRRSKAGGGYLVDWFLAEALNRGGVDPESPQEAEAIAALQRSVARNPDLAQSRVLLGKMLFRKGDLDGALAHLVRLRTCNGLLFSSPKTPPPPINSPRYMPAKARANAPKSCLRR